MVALRRFDAPRVIGPVALARKQAAAHLACDFLFFGVGALPRRSTCATELLRSCRVGAAPCLTPLQARLTPRLTPLCARLTPRQTSLLPAGLRSGSRSGLGRRACSAPGPQLWIPLAPWTEPTKPTWRVPEWKKSFDAKEFPFHFFAHVEKSSFVFLPQPLSAGGVILRRCDAR